MKNVVIIGAASAIAQEVAKLLAARNMAFCLVGRSEAKLNVIADDLKVRGAGAIHSLSYDLDDTAKHEELLDGVLKVMPSIDLVLICQGLLGNQTEAAADFKVAKQIIDTNFLSYVSLLTAFSNQLAQQKSGMLAVISSVAGDRGRQSNYVYGSAKAGLNTFLQGLRNHLFKSGVHVLTIKPGMVDTPMTKDFKIGPLFAKPEQVATAIVSGIDKLKNEIYAPAYWRLIMLIIRSIPEPVFKRLSL